MVHIAWSLGSDVEYGVQLKIVLFDDSGIVQREILERC